MKNKFLLFIVLMLLMNVFIMPVSADSWKPVYVLPMSEDEVSHIPNDAQWFYEEKPVDYCMTTTKGFGGVDLSHDGCECMTCREVAEEIDPDAFYEAPMYDCRGEKTGFDFQNVYDNLIEKMRDFHFVDFEVTIPEAAKAEEEPQKLEETKEDPVYTETDFDKLLQILQIMRDMNGSSDITISTSNGDLVKFNIDMLNLILQDSAAQQIDPAAGDNSGLYEYSGEITITESQPYYSEKSENYDPKKNEVIILH